MKNYNKNPNRRNVLRDIVLGVGALIPTGYLFNLACEKFADSMGLGDLENKTGETYISGLKVTNWYPIEISKDDNRNPVYSEYLIQTLDIPKEISWKEYLGAVKEKNGYNKLEGTVLLPVLESVK